MVLCIALVLLACTPAARPSEVESFDPTLADDPISLTRPTDPLACTERVAIPEIPGAYDARWSADSRSLVVSRIVVIPNPRMITGYEEDQRLSVLDLSNGTIRDLGRGSKPATSGSGAYVSYWREVVEDLRVIAGDRLAALVPATQPDVRWVGDTLYFWSKGEIRTWDAGTVRTVATVADELEPKYPRDLTAFSADAERFTITRYYADGGAERFIGNTRTGETAPLGDGNTLFTEWAPTGHALLLRSAAAVTLRGNDGADASATVAALAGPVHGWTADGRLFFGRMSPTTASALDRFTVFGADDIATLPNVLGVRAFSPNGRFFAGVTRTGLDVTTLELYRCSGLAVAHEPRADAVARARAASIESEGRRFVRPVSGAITQFVQGRHTGVDVAAPLGAILVAADDGVVDAVGWVPAGGRCVCVLHAGGLESCDYHTSLPLVSVGERVSRGQPVALVGMTGATSGPHVHWEAKLKGRIVDPLAR